MGDVGLPSAPVGDGDTELRRRRDLHREVERRPAPWLALVGVPVLLVLLALVGRGLVSTALGRDGATTALVTVGPLPTARDSADPSEPAVTTGSGGPAPVVPTVRPTPPPGAGRVILPLASPSTATAASAGPTATASAGPTATAPAGPTGTSPGRTGSPVVGVQSGRCIDVTGGSAADGTRMELLTCNGSAAQAITYTAASELRVLGKCLDAQFQSTSDGTAIILYTCNGQLNQKWTLGAGGTIRGVQSNRCLEAASQGRSDGTPLQLWTCTGAANQAWTP
jgi:hypothetical protein